jgi:hypothetical protein
VRGERHHRSLPAVDRAEGEVPRHLLRATLEHRVEDLLIWPQQGHAIGQVQADAPGGRTPLVTHRDGSLCHYI